MSYNKRRDVNHEQVRDELRQLGFAVYDAGHHGDGMPDLLVMARGVIYLVEVKATKRSRFTAAERKFFEVFNGAENLLVIDSVEMFLEKIA